MKINKMKALFKWSKPHILLMIVILLLTIIIPVTYSYVPQFVKYIFDYILLPNPDASNSLPQFLKDFFSSFEDLQSVLVVGITLDTSIRREISILSKIVFIVYLL